MDRFFPSVAWYGVIGFVSLACLSESAVSGEPKSPADGYDIRVQAPHMMHDDTVVGYEAWDKSVPVAIGHIST
jgi:hypothetical protein